MGLPPKPKAIEPTPEPKEYAVRAWLVPADESQEMRLVEGDNYRDIIKEHTDIQWPSRVNTIKTSLNNFVAVCCDDGRARLRPTNLRAMFLTEYPDILVGDYIMFSEAFDNESMGVDFTTLSDMGYEYLRGMDKTEYSYWRQMAIG